MHKQLTDTSQTDAQRDKQAVNRHVQTVNRHVQTVYRQLTYMYRQLIDMDRQLRDRCTDSYQTGAQIDTAGQTSEQTDERNLKPAHCNEHRSSKTYYPK